MIVERAYSELCCDVIPVLAEWTDEVVPDLVELFADHHYAPNYAWMYAYEKRLKYRIEEVLGQPLGGLERILFGPDGVLSEAISNAFVHGHHRDPSRPIRVGCRVGTRGLLFSIGDQGKGFDVTKVLTALGRGGAYFHVAGNGLQTFDKTPGVVVSFADGGRTQHIKLDLDQPGKG